MIVKSNREYAAVNKGHSVTDKASRLLRLSDGRTQHAKKVRGGVDRQGSLNSEGLFDCNLALIGCHD